MMEKKLQKRELRQLLKLRRESLNREYCAEADARILQHVKAMRQYRDAQMIFCYVSTPGEVDTWQLILEAWQEGKRIAVPRCEDNGIMAAYEICSPEDLAPGAWGIREPKESCLKIQPDQIQLCIVPCISADRQGVRLGYGGGYYDRYLPATGAYRVVLCREKMMREALPAEDHDCRMDAVVTEETVSRTAVKGSL